MNMTLRHLEIFKAVTETGSFTKAAERLFITQSAISHGIRDLEEMTGTPLFDRLSKRVEITKAGTLLLGEIQPILSASHALESRLKTLEHAAPIHIAAGITIANFYLPDFLKGFSTGHTPVIVDVVPAAAAIDYLKSAKADLALVEGPMAPGPFAVKAFGAYQLKAVCSPDYLPQGTTLTLDQFCKEKLLLREPGSAIRDTLDSQLYLAGFSPYPAWCSVNDSSLLEAAKAGLGIAILPEAYLFDALKNQHLVELSVPDLVLENTMHVVWHKEKYLSTPLKDFIEALCSASIT